jgi:2-enoate reductase
LSGKKVGQNIVVVGAGLVGIETALFLVQERKSVTLIEMTDTVGGDVGPLNLARLKQILLMTSIDIQCHTSILQIDPSYVTVQGEAGEFKIAADTVVLAVGATPQNYLMSALSGKIRRLYGIGDCKSPRKMLDAIREGYDIAIGIN